MSVSKHCRARTKAGKPCKAVAVDGGLCAFHADPKRAAQLGRMGGSKNRRHDPLGSETEPLRLPQTAKEVKDLLAEARAEEGLSMSIVGRGRFTWARRTLRTHPLSPNAIWAWRVGVLPSLFA